MSRITNILVTFILFIASGVAQTANAQEKSLTLPMMQVHKDSLCSGIESLFVMNNKYCNDKKIVQKDRVISNTISYTIESTYFEPKPTNIPDVLIEPPIITPTPTDAPLVQTHSDNVQAEGPSLDSNLIFDLINAHRATIGKPSFQKDPALCELAKTRSLELHDELFVNNNLHSGLYNRNLPYWITENAKWGSNENGTVEWWLSSPIHRSAIEGDYTNSCGACNGSMCSQLFTSYTPKN